MTRRSIGWLAGILLLCACAAQAMDVRIVTRPDEGVRLDLYVRAHDLRIVLANDTNQPVTVSRRFLLDAATGVGDISLDVVDAAGRHREFSAKINGGLPEKGDFVTLSPGQLVGSDVVLDDVRAYYQLKRGTYTVRATCKLQGAEGEAPHAVTSDPVRLSIP